MTLPIIHLTGDAHAQGVTHGRELSERVRHNRDIYFERFRREVGLTDDEVTGMALRYADAIKTQNAAYYAGMQGIGEGSGLTLGEIAALNVRYEILYYQFGKMALAKAAREPAIDGCTAFALLPDLTASGHLTMGQNWDWIPEVQGAILHTTDPDGWQTLAYTEAGIFGAKIGLNAAGVGLCVNGMTTTDDDWQRLARPFHVRCYEILRSPTFEDAVKVITGEARSCSTNFLVARAPGQVADVEAAPDKINLLACENGCLTHANHFVSPDALGVEETPNPRRFYSRNRQNRLRELLLAQLPATVDGIQDALRDTQDDPFGICRHRNPDESPELHYTTVTSVVMDLNTLTMHLTDGPPDTAPYQTVTLSA